MGSVEIKTPILLIPLLRLLPLLTGSGEAAGPVEYVVLMVMSVLLGATVVVLQHGLARWIIPLFVNCRRPKLVILFALVSLGAVTLGVHSVGLPPVIGAFAAGPIFSGNRWTKQIDALVLPFGLKANFKTRSENRQTSDLDWTA